MGHIDVQMRRDVCDSDSEWYDPYEIGLGNVHSRTGRGGHEAGLTGIVPFRLALLVSQGCIR